MKKEYEPGRKFKKVALPWILYSIISFTVHAVISGKAHSMDWR
jgi:hypothetical protein